MTQNRGRFPGGGRQGEHRRILAPASDGIPRLEVLSPALSLTEASRQQRPSGQAVKGLSELISNRPRGWIWSQIASFLGIVAQVVELLTIVRVPTDIRPLASFDRA